MFRVKIIPCLFWITFIILAFGLESFAQQTIITVPSSEVLPAGDMIIKESNRFSPFPEDAFINMTPSLIFGTGHGTEFSAGASTALDGETLVRGDFAAKKVFFIKESSRFTVGARINPYFTGPNTADTFVYSHFTHRIKETKTSLTAGVYAASRRNYLPNSAGALFGVEQVIIRNKLRVAVDWISREDSIGNLGAGIKYRPIPTLSLTAAVIVPNMEDERVSFNFSISKFVSLKDFYNSKKGEL